MRALLGLRARREVSAGHISAPPLSGFGPHSFPAFIRFHGSKYGRQQPSHMCPPPAGDLKGQEEGIISLEPSERWCHGGEAVPREPMSCRHSHTRSHAQKERRVGRGRFLFLPSNPLSCSQWAATQQESEEGAGGIVPRGQGRAWQRRMESRE